MTLCSMTGFGRATRKTARGEYVVELRSLNNRFLDINLRLPTGLAAFEPALREVIQQGVSRGKIDCTIRWEPAEEVAPTPHIVPGVVERLIHQAQDIRRRRQGMAPLSVGDFLRVPGVVQEPTQDDFHPGTLKAIGADMAATARKALEALRDARAKEGRALGESLRGHHATLVQALEAVGQLRGLVVQRYRERLGQRIQELLRGSDGAVDPGRLEFEIALFADKADISEEIDRLRSHLDTFAETLMKEDEPVGRPLDFLVQEMLREVNTIGSKARDTDIAAQVLAMKNAVESIKEQVQNLE